MSRQNNEPPLTQEQIWAGKMAMAARDAAAADVTKFLKAHDLKKFCIEKAVDAMKQSSVNYDTKGQQISYHAEELARKFYQFLTEE